ncbi:transcription factor S [Candidatus Woesearchaeota archaeon]|nr:transcription factor S [Candidatus Woesearchaeota archaeon]
MMFCPKCGSLLLPKKHDGRKVLVCRCGYASGDAGAPTLTENVTRPDAVAVVESEDAEKTHPLVDAECPKCRHGKAYYWTVQTRAGDEAPTQFFRCEKCKHSWRDYN